MLEGLYKNILMANTKILQSGLKYLGILLFLLIASPLLLTLGFKALKLYNQTPQKWVSFLIIGFAAVMILFTILFAFKTFRILMDAFFKES